MKNLNSNRKIAMFHIGRGGHFHNQGYLTFKGFSRIDECPDWNEHTFLNDSDEDGNLLPEEAWRLTQGDGGELINAAQVEVLVLRLRKIGVELLLLRCGEAKA